MEKQIHSKRTQESIDHYFSKLEIPAGTTVEIARACFEAGWRACRRRYTGKKK